MKTIANSPVPALRSALILLPLLVATPNAFSQGQIILKGRVITANATEQRAFAEIVASDGERMPVEIRPNGRFWICAPATDSYVLRFSQPGCITKEVIVDARLAGLDPRARDRKVTFDVLLHEEGSGQAMRFAEPVGRIEFRSSHGDAHVSHHYELVPVSSFTAEGVEQGEEH